MDSDRDLLAACGEIGGSRDIPAEPDDHVDAMFADQFADLRHQAGEPSGKAQGRRIRAAGKGQAGNDKQVIAASGHESGLESLHGTEYTDHRVRLAGDDAVGDREQGVDVPGGSPAREEVPGHLRRPAVDVAGAASGA